MYNTYEITTKNGKSSNVRGISPTDSSIKKALIDFVTLSKEEKRIKEEKDKAANTLRTFIANVRNFFAKKSIFTKTYRIEEKTDDIVYAVDITASERYTLPTNKEDISKLKKELSKGVYDQLFEESITIKIKDIIANDPKKRKELLKILVDTLGEDKFKEYFTKEESIDIKEGFMEKVYQLSDDEREILFRYVKPSLDSVKDTSYIPERS